MRRNMLRNIILVSRVMTRMCLLLLMPPRIRVLRECNYCHKFGHKKTNCRKLKVIQENKGDDKQESN